MNKYAVRAIIDGQEMKSVKLAESIYAVWDEMKERYPNAKGLCVSIMYTNA